MDEFDPVVYNEISVQHLKDYLLGLFDADIRKRYVVTDVFISGDRVVIKIVRDYLKKPRGE